MSIDFANLGVVLLLLVLSLVAMGLALGAGHIFGTHMSKKYEDLPLFARRDVYLLLAFVCFLCCGLTIVAAASWTIRDSFSYAAYPVFMVTGAVVAFMDRQLQKRR